MKKRENKKLEFKEKKRLIIIDSDALLYRAYYALPPLKTKTGELVNAVYGFLLVFLKIIREFHPDFIVAAFDFPSPTFRHQEFKEYKAKRSKTPEDLREQFPKIKKILKNFKVPIFEKEKFEADDIIASLKFKTQGFFDHPSRRGVTGKAKLKNIIVSGDLDLLQLIDENTKVYFLKRGVKEAVLYDEKKTKERYQGLSPEQLPDFKGLRGDPSDNIPGVLGIGEKTAISLIKKFGTLENLYEKIEKGSGKAEEIKKTLKEKLLKHKKEAFLSKMLAEIRFDIPVDIDLRKCQWGNYDKEKIRQVFKEYQFQTLLNRLP